MTFVRVSHLLSLEWVICWELCLELKVGTWAGQHYAALHETPSVNSKSKMSKGSRSIPLTWGISLISTDHRSDRSVILWALCGQDPFELDANLQEASEQALFLQQWSSSTRMAACLAAWHCSDIHFQHATSFQALSIQDNPRSMNSILFSCQILSACDSWY
jgi:hypothetical protein